jgi:ABC-type multidrug transport system fused ATPase/permease subunit
MIAGLDVFQAVVRLLVNLVGRFIEYLKMHGTTNPKRENIFEHTKMLDINTFAAIVDLSRFNNSCLRLLKISDDNNE